MNDPRLRVFVIWEPILPSDWARPGTGVLSRVSDRRAAQFWDKRHLFAKQLSQALESDKEHPEPRCCDEGGILWDVVVVYPRRARWEKSLPRAAVLNGPVVRMFSLRDLLIELLPKQESSEP